MIEYVMYMCWVMLGFLRALWVYALPTYLLHYLIFDPLAVSMVCNGLLIAEDGLNLEYNMLSLNHQKYGFNHPPT